jgi:curved DNA-binding protein CbpA
MQMLFQIKEAYRIKAKMVHPDTGGSELQFNELQAAYKQALESFE